MAAHYTHWQSKRTMVTPHPYECGVCGLFLQQWNPLEDCGCEIRVRMKKPKVFRAKPGQTCEVLEKTYRSARGSVREPLLAPGDLVVFVGSLSATTVLISTHDPTTQPNGAVRMCAMDIDSLRALSPLEVLARCDRE